MTAYWSVEELCCTESRYYRKELSMIAKRLGEPCLS